MIFRRKKDGAAPDSKVSGPDPTTDDSGPDTPSGSAAGTTSEDVTSEVVPDLDPLPDRTSGPFDSGEVDDSDESTQRIDLGAVRIPLFEGLEIRVEIDEESNQPMAVTLVRGAGAVQVRAFSAPRSGGGWAEARTEIRRSITRDGGTVDDAAGGFGPELRAQVVGEDNKGNRVMQPIRFVGVDGPRWMLQGVLLGVGAQPDTAGELEEVFRGIVVVRGEEAMPPGNALPLALPDQSEIDDSDVIESDEDDGL